MLSDLILLHRRQGPSIAEPAPALAGESLLWRTCLRQILIGPAAVLDDVELHPEDHVYRGDEAFRFCLEIVCGLHSPLVGETEVFGQFKNAIRAWLEGDDFRSELRRFFQAVIEDAKKVRAAHLAGIGGQSYGSLLRKELSGVSEVHVIGAGHLAEEILPWIHKDGTQVHVHARRVEHAQRLREAHANLRVHALNGRAPLSAAGAIVIAAPVSSEWVTQWIHPVNGRIDQIADLRGESVHDPLSEADLQGRVIHFRDLLEKISANRSFLESRRLAALEMISQISAHRARRIEYRPFGWDDVCA